MRGREVEYFQVFHEVSRALLSVLDSKTVLHLIAKRLVSPLDAKASALMLLDENTRRLELVAFHRLSQRYLGKGPVAADRSIADALSGRPVLVENAPEDERIQYKDEAKEEGIASILSVPMIVKGQILGVLRIYTAQPRRFTNNELQLVSAIAEIGAIAIENARIFEARGAELSELLKAGGLEYESGNTLVKYPVQGVLKGEIDRTKSYHYFRTLYRLTKTITSTTGMEETLGKVAREIGKAMLVKGCNLLWLNMTTGELELLASFGLSHTYLAKGPLRIDKSIPQALEGETVHIADARRDTRIQYPDAAHREGITSMVSVPISVKERVRGVLRLYSSNSTPFREEEIQFARVLAEIAGIAIINAKLYQERTNDIAFWKATLDYLGLRST
ncbi:MAG: GAF domain-containing protein [Proteobacteria bacterium]|nr:GAF domain-containing protein [Pseudomonadota bacterium]